MAHQSSVGGVCETSGIPVEISKNPLTRAIIISNKPATVEPPLFYIIYYNQSTKITKAFQQSGKEDVKAIQ